MAYESKESSVPRVIDWATIYAESDLEACRTRFRRDLRHEWVGLGRGLARALGVRDVFEGVRDDVPPVGWCPATVFILGHLKSENEEKADGCLGHVAATVGVRGGPVVEESERRIAGGSRLASHVAEAMLSTVHGLNPDAAIPSLEVVTPRGGEGDSHGLAIALAVLHALLGASVRAGTAASGGFDPETARFRPVAPDSLRSKAAAATRWGVRRILVVEGQEIPRELRNGPVEWCEVSSEPAGLVLELIREPKGVFDSGGPDVLRQALALYDVRIARASREPLGRILEVTEPFLRGDLDDPVLEMLAADIRSRALLHAGRSVESANWNRVADERFGQGDLPAGLLGDHLLYQRPSHESVIAIDLGVLEDEAMAHRAVDRAIEDLDERWCTRHQTLLHLFARNTRWRRLLYRARRDGDFEALSAAERDLLHFRDRWDELLVDHATRRLEMGNSDLARQWNYVLEHQVSKALMLAGKDSEVLDRPVDEAVLGEVGGDADLVGEIRRREACIDALSNFDLRGLLQGWWLLGSPDVVSARDELERRLALGATAGDAIWVEWFRRQVGPGAPSVMAVLEAAVRPHLAEVEGEPAGIGRLIALRRAAILDHDGHSGPSGREGPGWVEAIRAPDGPPSLAEAFADLRRSPKALLVRAPY